MINIGHFPYGTFRLLASRLLGGTTVVLGCVHQLDIQCQKCRRQLDTKVLHSMDPYGVEQSALRDSVACH